MNISGGSISSRFKALTAWFLVVCLVDAALNFYPLSDLRRYSGEVWSFYFLNLLWAVPIVVVGGLSALRFRLVSFILLALVVAFIAFYLTPLQILFLFMGLNLVIITVSLCILTLTPIALVGLRNTSHFSASQIFLRLVMYSVASLILWFLLRYGHLS